MIIDFHTHVFPPWVLKERESFCRTDACFGMLYENPAARLAVADDLLRSMDEERIDVSVVLNIGWTTHEMCVRTNDYLLEVALLHPDRLVAFCSVNPGDGYLAVEELQRCARSGAKGIGELRPDIQGYTLGSPELDAMVQAADETGMVILSHVSEPVGHTYPGKGAIGPEQAYRFAMSHPDVPLVCAHWGGGLPFYALMPEVKRTLANTYFDTAASHYLYENAVFQTVGSLVGADKILLGSDYPLIRQSRAMAEVERSTLVDADKRLVLGGNASRLLGLES